MTKEEKHLWYDFLKRLPLEVKRQYIIENYIVDFYIPSKNVVIEVDGIQHTTTENANDDQIRDNRIAGWNISVLRYSNRSIADNFDDVANDILQNIGLCYSDLKPIK